MITVTCPNCQDTLNVPEQYAGQRGTCKKCGGQLLVPALDAGAGAGGLPADLASMLDESLNKARPRPVVLPATMADRLQPLIKPLGLLLGVVAVGAIVFAGLAYLPKLGLGTPSPEKVTQSFMQALDSGNTEQCKPYLTAQSLQNFDLMFSQFPKLDGYTVGTATNSGDTSQVPVQITLMGNSQNSETLLRKDGGNWRIYGMRMMPMPGMKMTMDFEHPEAMLDDLKGMMKDMPPEMTEMMEKEFQKQFQQSMQQQQQPAQ